MKVAIVGAGRIGAIHAQAYRANNADLVAVVEPVESIGEAFAQEYAISHYLHLETLLGSPDRPDAISICSPPFTHRPIIEQCIEAGVDVLCEKPLAHTIEDAEAIAQLARQTSSIVAVGYCHRFQPEIEIIHTMVRNGAIGTIRTFYNSFSGNQPGIESSWFGKKELSGGGVIIDAGIHSIDLFRFLCGEVIEASGTYSTMLDSLSLAVEHTAVIGLLSSSQVIGTIDCSWKSPEGSAVVHIAGTAGALQFDYSKPGIVVHEKWESGTQAIRIEQGDRFVLEIASFLSASRSGNLPRTGAHDGLEGMKIITQIYRQNRPDGQGTAEHHQNELR